MLRAFTILIMVVASVEPRTGHRTIAMKPLRNTSYVVFNPMYDRKLFSTLSVIDKGRLEGTWWPLSDEEVRRIGIGALPGMDKNKNNSYHVIYSGPAKEPFPFPLP